MPQQSQYNDAQFEMILNDVLACLEKHQTTRDLSLMGLAMLLLIYSHNKLMNVSVLRWSNNFVQY